MPGLDSPGEQRLGVQRSVKFRKSQWWRERQCSFVLNLSNRIGFCGSFRIIFNFFEDSEADFADFVAILEPHELDLSESRLGHRSLGLLSQRRVCCCPFSAFRELPR